MKISKLFSKIYSLFHNDCFVLERLKLNSVGRFLTRKIANAIIPIWYCVVKGGDGVIANSRTIPVIISLTSFPSRIERIWITLESLLRQTMKPDRIMLWLSLDQFPNKEQDLPESLVSLIERGLEIEFVEGDIKSHKKYYYVMSKYPDSIIVTADDDIYYPEDMLENLWKEHEMNREAVICSYARCLEWNESSKILESSRIWKYIKKRHEGYGIFFGTGGGVLFPPIRSSLYKDTLNLDLALKLCPKEDDLWLNTMARLQRTYILASIRYRNLLNVSQEKTITLYSENGGDLCLTDVQINDVIDYYKSKGMFPYIYIK